MHIKRFEAASMAEAIRRVKEELGPEAVVLTSRNLRTRSRWLGTLRRPIVEVTAAVDRDRRSVPEGPARTSRASRASRGHADPSWQPLQVTRALLEPLEDELRELRGLVEEVVTRNPVGELAAELDELRRIARGLQGAGRVAVSEPREAGFLRAGISSVHAAALARDAEARVADGSEPASAMVDALEARLQGKLAAPRTVDAPSQLTVGATGVGKTTSVAKLADRQGPGARLVTADVQRMGGSAALKESALALGIPFQQVVSPRALVEVVRRGGGPLLVDTPGCSPGNRAALAQLAGFRRALGAQGRVQLALSATTKESDLRAQLRFCRPLEPEGLVLTHLDESVDLGNVVNLLLDPDTPPLAWVGCGPGIPEDLSVPDAGELARRALQGVLP